MIFSALVIFTVFALLMDYYILRRSLPNVVWLRALYIAQALVLDVGILLYLLISFFVKTIHTHQMAIVMLWVMLIFITSFGCKLIFSFFAVAQWVVERMSGCRSRVLARIGSTLVVLVLGVVLYSVVYDTHQIRVESVTITDAALPEAFDGFTIAQFSDAHLGNFGSDRLIRKLVTQINQLNPDIVVQTGDLVNIHAGELDSTYMSLFSEINAPVFSLLGNHDLGYYIQDESIDPTQSVRDLIDKQQQLGWRLLRNESRWIKRSDSLSCDSIALCGVTYPQDGRFGVRNNPYGGSDMRRAFAGTDSAFSIFLSHSPVLFDSLPMLGLDPSLTISGHVHSMQAKITIGEWKFSPASWLFSKWSGLYVEHGRSLYINDGLGYALYPLRVGTRPELTLYTLKKGRK